MIFVRRLQFDSIYRDRNGHNVFVPHGWITRYDLDSDTLAHLWERYQGDGWPRKSVHSFLIVLPDMLTPDSNVDDVVLCEDCDDPHLHDDLFTAADRAVCESCLENYSSCDRCDDRVHNDDIRYTMHDSSVCDYCADNYYSWCEECEGIYNGDDGCPGDCSQGCDCEAPRQKFVIKAGEDRLANDERLVVSLPSGVVSEVGMQQIARLIGNEAYSVTELETRNALYNLSHDLSQGKIDAKVQTKDGNFTKRVSRYAWKTYSVKIQPDLLTKIGNIAADQSKGADYNVEVTRNLNLPAAAFAHEDSCWWQSYAYSRCMLKSNGGFGLRTFSAPDGYGYVEGRAWVMPLKDVDGTLVATLETETPDAFVVFNGYGNLSGYAPARIMAHLSGMTYRKVGFSAGEAYINNGGYLVSSEEICARYTDGYVDVDAPTHSDLEYREARAANAAA